MQRSLMQSSISAPSIGGIVRLTKFIVRSTLGIELIGAAMMSEKGYTSDEILKHYFKETEVKKIY